MTCAQRCAFVLAFVLFPAALACADDLRLGRYELVVDRKAQPLTDRTPVTRGVRSYRFLRGVGGVAFGGEAASGDASTLLDLKYSAREADADIDDGQRLRAVMRLTSGEVATVIVPAHDWLLVPLAIVAAGEQHALFTLFGTLDDESRTDAVLKRGHRVLGYHDGVRDTLLGLRLFQADVMGLEESFCDLPRRAGRYLLAPSERTPSQSVNVKLLERVHSGMEDKHPGSMHTSYVVCDVNQTIRFTVAGRRLELSGQPYWWCWESLASDDVAGELAWKLANEEANQKADAKFSGEFDADKSKLSTAAFNAKWSTERQQARYDQLFQEEFEAIASARFVKAMPAYSDTYTSLMRANQGANPEVYAVLVDSMRVLALLRHFKAKHPDAFKDFVASVRGKSAGPVLRTPDIMRPIADE